MSFTVFTIVFNAIITFVSIMSVALLCDQDASSSKLLFMYNTKSSGVVVWAMLDSSAWLGIVLCIMKAYLYDKMQAFVDLKLTFMKWLFITHVSSQFMLQT